MTTCKLLMCFVFFFVVFWLWLFSCIWFMVQHHDIFWIVWMNYTFKSVQWFMFFVLRCVFMFKFFCVCFWWTRWRTMGENTTCWYCVCCPLFRVIVILRVNYLLIAHFLVLAPCFLKCRLYRDGVTPWYSPMRRGRMMERRISNLWWPRSMLTSNGSDENVLCAESGDFPVWWSLSTCNDIDVLIALLCVDVVTFSFSLHPSSHSLCLWFLPIPMDHTVCVYKVLMSWLEIESILWFIALRRIEFAMWSPERDWFVVMWSLWIIPLFGNWYYNHSNVFSSVLALFQCLRYLWGAEMKLDFLLYSDLFSKFYCWFDLCRWPRPKQTNVFESGGFNSNFRIPF